MTGKRAGDDTSTTPGPATAHRDGDRVETRASTTGSVLSEPAVRSYVRSVGGLYAVLGAGFGLLSFLAGTLDSSVLQPSGESGLGASFGLGIVQSVGTGLATVGVPFLAAVLAVAVGYYAGRTLDEADAVTYAAAGCSTLVGTVAMWGLSAFLTLTQVEGVSLSVVDFVVHALLAGLVVGAVAVGTVRLVRTDPPNAYESGPQPASTRQPALRDD
ncbi:hypothetical protein [Haloarchaeobius amylolyticus]|uniref:hypothetical protein n=1 Tax=Haloarchaeobius amylolyticus TaxID=1198296 RepID=UPI00226D53AC|nr:hypothetical protein [Haloarchaeobius amylolyticus]